MTEKEVIDAIEYMQEYQTETDKLEAKTAEKGCPQKCYDTISAFANKRGGIIIFGINEHNNFIEQDVYNVNDLLYLLLEKIFLQELLLMIMEKEKMFRYIQ